MTKRTERFGRAVLLAGAWLLLAPPAHAKIPIPVNTGNEVFEVGPLPPELQANPKLAGWKLGYMCDRFGILWANVWTWNCKLVAYDGAKNSYTDLPPEWRESLEAKHPMSKAKRGFWNHYGIPLALLGLVGLKMVGGSAPA
jgi:hypothetical protein